MGSLSDYYSSVQKMLARMNATSMRDFTMLQDDEDRIKYVLNLQGVDEILGSEPRFEKKCNRDAKVYRECGNKLYVAKKYDKALEQYNRAILCADWPVMDNYSQVIANEESCNYSGPTEFAETHAFSEAHAQAKQPNNTHQQTDERNNTDTHNYRDSAGVVSKTCIELPLALGNRSATLYQLGYYNECISDINLALCVGFQSHLKYKLYDRKGRCLMETKRYAHAAACFYNVIETLENTNLNLKQKSNIHENCEKQIIICQSAISEVAERAKEISEKKCGEMLIESDFTPSKQLPNATDGLEIRYSQSQGRYTVTSRPVNIGEVVISESPHASVLNPQLWKRRCFHCFTRLPIAPIPCCGCSTVRYCSEKCRLHSWTHYHQDECHYLGLLQSSGTGVLAHLALRVILCADDTDIFKCVSSEKSKQNSQKGLFTNSQGVFLGGFVSLYNLLTHSTGRDANEIYQFTILAVYLLNILQHCGFVNDMVKSTHDGIHIEDQTATDFSIMVGGVILRFIQIIACNGIEITELSAGSNITKTNPESIGLALFPTVSLLNHSCNPLVEILFHENRCIAKAIQNIPKGAEVTIDYGYIYYTTPKSQRQTNLRAQYHFVCECLACREKWSLKSRLPDGIPPLKCCQCGTRLLIGGQKHPLQNKCRSCGVIHNPIEIFETLRESSVRCEKAIEKARSFDTQSAIPVLEGHITLLARHICEPYKEYTTCVSVLKQCYRVLGNKDPEMTKIVEKFD